ncbi:MAG: cupin domain-containing protein [Pseudomonadota bacterium]
MPPSKINIAAAADRQITSAWDPHLVGDINSAQVKVAKFGPAFDWHHHEHEDEAFFVLRGRIAIDFRDGAVEMKEGDFLAVPRGVDHRPRSLTDDPIVLLFEPNSTLNTGDAESDHTVSRLKRLVSSDC